MSNLTTNNVLLAPLFHLELIKDRDIPYDGNAKTTVAAAQVFHDLSDRSPTEMMMVMYVNSHSEIIGVEKVGMGAIESVGTNPQEIFRGALVKGAPEIILSHNHPSGEAKPSLQDVLFTINTANTGGMLGIRVRDHIVVAPSGKHMSLRENMHGELKELFIQAEVELFGAGMPPELKDLLKQKILGMIDPSKGGLDTLDRDSIMDLDLSGQNKNKKSFDPKANTASDWMESLSYLWLTMGNLGI